MPENAKGGRADIDDRVDDLFFNYLGEGYVKCLRRIIGCEIRGYFTGSAIGMVPEIGMMMKRSHHYRGEEKENQQNRDSYTKCFAIHLQPRTFKRPTDCPCLRGGPYVREPCFRLAVHFFGRSSESSTAPRCS